MKLKKKITLKGVLFSCIVPISVTKKILELLDPFLPHSAMVLNWLDLEFGNSSIRNAQTIQHNFLVRLSCNRVNLETLALTVPV